MKNYTFLFLKFVIMSLLMFVVYNVFANTETVPDDLEGFTKTVEVLYGAIVIIMGYVTKAIPKLNNLDNVWRVLAIAIATAVVMITLGLSTGFNLLFSYAGATSFYELFLKPFFPTNAMPLNRENKLKSIKKK